MLIDAEYSRKSSFGEGSHSAPIVLGIYAISKILKSMSTYSALEALAGLQIQLATFLFFILFLAFLYFAITEKPWKLSLSIEQVRCDFLFLTQTNLKTKRMIDLTQFLFKWATSFGYSILVLIHLVVWTIVLEYFGPIKFVFGGCNFHVKFAVFNSNFKPYLYSDNLFNYTNRTMLMIDYSEVTLVSILDGLVNQKRKRGNQFFVSCFLVFAAYAIALFSSGYIEVLEMGGEHYLGKAAMPPMGVAIASLFLTLVLSLARKRLYKRLTRNEPYKSHVKGLAGISTGFASLLVLPIIALQSSTKSPISSSWSFTQLALVIIEVSSFFLVFDFIIESNTRRRVASNLLSKIGFISQVVFSLLFEWLTHRNGSIVLSTFVSFGLLIAGQHMLLQSQQNKLQISGDELDDDFEMIGNHYHDHANGHATHDNQSEYGRSSGVKGGKNFVEMLSQISVVTFNWVASLGNQSSQEDYLRSRIGRRNQMNVLDENGGQGSDFGLNEFEASNSRSSSSIFRTLNYFFSSSNMMKTMSHIFEEIWNQPTSRKIFLFMLVNFAFMFVELLYGIWTNSLGLITDAFHMLFDCIALGIGLYAEVVSKWQANKVFSFGFGRVEVLAGYLNGIFLCFISFSIFAHSLIRMWSPPDVLTDRLLLISCLGLGVNLVGIFAFHDFDVLELMGLKSKKHEDHDHDHENHQHGGHSHGNNHGSCTHDHHHSDNLYGIFLHILADALGSVSVIISSLLIWMFKWNIVDPICSLLISVLIFASVIPLLKSSFNVLMQSTPKSSSNQSLMMTIIQELQSVPGIQNVSKVHFWSQTPSHRIASAHISTSQNSQSYNSNDQIISYASNVLSQHGFSDITIQINQIGK